MKGSRGRMSQGRRNHIYDPSRQLLAEEVFWAMLDRERALADRADRRFALVVFNIAPRGSEDGGPMAVINAVQAKVRLTDAVGFVDPDRIGVLLANAHADGAKKLGATICAAVGAKGFRASCEVYAYPLAADSLAQEDFIREHGAGEPGEEPDPDVVMASLRKTHELLAPPVPAWKRVVDVALSSLAMVVLSPLFLAFAAYIKLVSPGPVFFKQPRVGRACRIFMCLKFRTMHVNADAAVHAEHMAKLIQGADTPMAKLEFQKDARLIPFAKVIRAAGLDELPQLINVLRGEMSLVGPRPCIPYEFEQFSTWHRRRFDALPGLTGLWQVMGKNRTSFTQMMRYDIRYASTVSPGEDTNILLRTLPAVVTQVKMVRKGAGPGIADTNARGYDPYEG